MPGMQRELDQKSEDRGLCIIHLLLRCSESVHSRSIEPTNLYLDHLAHLASLTGDPLQRVASYFMSALANRITSQAWPGLHKALNSTSLECPPTDNICSARQLFYHLCPYLPFAFTTFLHSIVESILQEGEKSLHIIDLGDWEALQWLPLLHLLNTRQGGAPHLTLTMVHESKEVLEKTGIQLSAEANHLHVPFQFFPICSPFKRLQTHMFNLKAGEPIAIAAVLKLHQALGEEEERETLIKASHSTRNEQQKDGGGGGGGGACPSEIDRLLSMFHAMSPKLMLVMEQESNQNGGSLVDRFMEALYYYAAIFDCFESTLAMAERSRERVAMEKYLFGQEIQNIVASEGSQRIHRFEPLRPSWCDRMERAGFNQSRFSFQSILEARQLLSHEGHRYLLEVDRSCIFLCWLCRLCPLQSLAYQRVPDKGCDITHDFSQLMLTLNQ